jgi:hypothetical protein
MTIFALCCFAEGLDPDPDAATEALRAAGYEVFRLPPALKATLEIKGDDFIEVRGEGNDDEDSRDAMEADVNRILSPFGGEIDCSAFRTIAEMWTPTPPCCAHCSYPGTPNRPLLSIDVGVGSGVLLHSDCWKPWLDELIAAGPRLFEELPF